MTWGTYYFFYECPQCGKKYRYELEGSADEEFGKRAKYLHKMDAGPYWLCETADGFYTTCGGIKVNEKTQVLDKDGKVIEGLYATGNVSGNFYAGNYPRHIPGTSVGRAATFGYVAVEHMLKGGQA